MKKNGRVVGVGSALVDLLLHEDEVFVSRLTGAKGGMTYVEAEFAQTVLDQSAAQATIVPGGSACNTIVGIGRLGGSCRMIGKLGRDELGEFFARGLSANSVEPVLTYSDTPTGRVLSIITPDAERTMFTCLGASAEMTSADVDPAGLADADIVHAEGYLLFNHDLIKDVLQKAKAAGALISLDLAAYTVVEASQAYLGQLVEEYVDILIANEDEARVFTGHTEEEKALATLADRSAYAVLKLGKRGSLIAHDGEVVEVAAQGDGHAVDTTGAGDLWASGFLYGLTHGMNLEQAGWLGSACGYEVCQVSGAAIPDDGWARINSLRDELLGSD